MHFSIPDTQECKEENGSAYVAYNIHINGVFHCTVRYRQLHSLHQQLCKDLGTSALPTFPPKKLLSLSTAQTEERRCSLEKYILLLSQDQQVLTNDVFNGFLVWAQNETQRAGGGPEEVAVDVYLLNGQKITVQITATLQTDDLLEKVCGKINLPSRLVYYFALFLVKKDGNAISVMKRLQDFESPYISQRCTKLPHKIVLRKNYWDSVVDEVVIQDRVGLNLLYVQTVSDVERGWILTNKQIQRQLAALQAKGAKKEYLEVARTLKYFGYLQFDRCVCDFPEPQTSVVISAGDRELNFRIESEDGTTKEGNFKVTRMRCWRISTQMTKNGGTNNINRTIGNDEGPTSSSICDGEDGAQVVLELAFEYLMSRNEMRWIRVNSPQAVLMSMCLQGMVQQLLTGSNGLKVKTPNERVRKGSLTYLHRNGTTTHVVLNHTGENTINVDCGQSPIGELSWRRLTERLSDISFRDSSSRPSSHLSINASSTADTTEPNTVENNAFNIICDENL